MNRSKFALYALMVAGAYAPSILSIVSLSRNFAVSFIINLSNSKKTLIVSHIKLKVLI